MRKYFDAVKGYDRIVDAYDMRTRSFIIGMSNPDLLSQRIPLSYAQGTGSAVPLSYQLFPHQGRYNLTARQLPLGKLSAMTHSMYPDHYFILSETRLGSSGADVYVRFGGASGRDNAYADLAAGEIVLSKTNAPQVLEALQAKQSLAQILTTLGDAARTKPAPALGSMQRMVADLLSLEAGAAPAAQ